MHADLPTYRVLFPEHAAVIDALIEVQLSQAQARLSRSGWGRCYPNAVLTWAAHEVALMQARQASTEVSEDGAVLSQASGTLVGATVGSLSVTFATPAAVQTEEGAYYAQTPYGQRYLALARECLGRGRLVG